MLGTEGRQSLIRPSPVGSTQHLTVNIETVGSSVRATVVVVVEQSRADGSSDTLLVTTTGLSASDQLMAEALSSRVGASLRVERGSNRQVTAFRDLVLNHPGQDDGDAEEAVDYWLQELLEAAVRYVGPLPEEDLGQGAVWDVTFLSESGVRYVRRLSLERLDADRFVINVESQTDPSSPTADAVSVVLEGLVGGVLPQSQHISVVSTSAIGEATEIVTTISTTG